MHLFSLSFSLMCNQYSDFKKNVLLNKAWVLRFFLAVICADFLGFFSLPTFMSEVEGLGWQTGSWTKGHAKTTKLPGPDHVASSACFSLQPQAVSWCNADASIFPPSNAGFMFSYCSQQLLFYLSFFLSGEE